MLLMVLDAQKAYIDLLSNPPNFFNIIILEEAEDDFGNYFEVRMVLLICL